MRLRSRLLLRVVEQAAVGGVVAVELRAADRRARKVPVGGLYGRFRRFRRFRRFCRLSEGRRASGPSQLLPRRRRRPPHGLPEARRVPPLQRLLEPEQVHLAGRLCEHKACEKANKQRNKQRSKETTDVKDDDEHR